MIPEEKDNCQHNLITDNMAYNKQPACTDAIEAQMLW